MRNKRHSRQALATAAALYAPSPERLQHDRITRPLEQIVDDRGDIGLPFLVEGLLARMERHGDISASERAAGEEFGRLFRLGWSDPLRAADMAQTIRSTGGSHLPHGGEDARRRITAALKALGHNDDDALPAACAWFVLGADMSLREWTQRRRWMGGRLNEHNAKGVLLSVLSVLARHFGV